MKNKRSKTDRSLATNLARLEKPDDAKCTSRALRQSGTWARPSSSHRSESKAVASSLSGRRDVASDADEDCDGGVTTRSSLLFVRLVLLSSPRSSSTALFFPVLDFGAKKDVIMMRDDFWCGYFVFLLNVPA